MAQSSPRRPVLVGNVSGSTGDRLDGLKCMLRGPTKVDVIVGDWMSEANLSSRSLQLRAGQGEGYEPGFLHSLRIAIDDYLAYENSNLRIAVNAGGLNPKALATKVQELLSQKGSNKRVTYITGDNLLPVIDTVHIDPLTHSTGDFAAWRAKHPEIIQANAYIGCWGIVRALREGADIVICGRCTDASPVMAAAAWWHDWGVNDFNLLAGSLAAGHLIECGCYATGGNYGNFESLQPHYHDLSYPIAEIASTGMAIIQKQPGQNGVVNVDTLRGQLLYEIQGLYYYNPDVIANLANIKMEQVGKDRVLVSGVKGLPAPETLKVAVMALGGYQAEFSVYITGLKAEEKARSFEAMARRIVDTSQFEVLDFQLYGTPRENPRNQLEATVQLRVFAQSRDAKNLTAGRFLGPMMSNQLQGYPGLTANLDYRTAAPKLICTYFPGLFDRRKCQQTLHFVNEPGKTICVQDEASITPRPQLPKQLSSETTDPVPLQRFGPSKRVALGSQVFSRSGDKGANVNVGLFFPAGKDMNKKYDWLRSFLTIQNFRTILADEVASDVLIERCEFPQLQAVNFVIHGHLGTGVSSTSNMDSLGKVSPLHGTRVLELAGLAPGPFAGLLCADWGATVLRVDRPTSAASDLSSKDLLTRRKSSIVVDLKSTDGINTIRDIIKHVDVVIDPFRPGVLEKLGLGPAELTLLNPRLIIARMTGFRRDGKYSKMAGHDINYVAVSGVLSMLGSSDGLPSPPMNLLGDFAGGGLVCFLGIVLALLDRTSSGRGQVVEANMVDGSAFIATSPRLNMKTSLWNRERGTNLLDGGCPYYAVYETKDSGYMAVGALEPQFFAILVEKLKPYGLQCAHEREDRSWWPQLKAQLTDIFRSESRAHWESVFDGTDACVTPVLKQQELEASQYEQRPIVRLSTSPALPGTICGDDGYNASPLRPGNGGVQVLSEWMGWEQGRDFDETERGIVRHAIKFTKL
ncbi:DUF1446 domain protein [Fusarium sp. NRRL 52700]|nr:DUF1446 domain protein [Fusarium sp. NRRL 52700]